MAIERDQKKFFDEYASTHQRQEPVNSFFYDLAVAEVRRGFAWMGGCESVLEYGCGTGDTIDLFLASSNHRPGRIIGIDLSEVSVEVAKRRHPFEFHVVPDNDLTFLPEGSLDGAYMIGVLHHSENHRVIFEQVARVLKPGGKFLILDLTRSNPFVELARAVFPYMPKRVKRMFPDDLVVDDNIPEKLRVDVDATLALLGATGFAVEMVDYGHLYYFLFDWFERAARLNLSKTRFRAIYMAFYRLEKSLLRFGFFRRRAHLFVVRATKCAGPSARLDADAGGAAAR